MAAIDSLCRNDKTDAGAEVLWKAAGGVCRVDHLCGLLLPRKHLGQIGLGVVVKVLLGLVNQQNRRARPTVARREGHEGHEGPQPIAAPRDIKEAPVVGLDEDPQNGPVAGEARLDVRLAPGAVELLRELLGRREEHVFGVSKIRGLNGLQERAELQAGQCGEVAESGRRIEGDIH